MLTSIESIQKAQSKAFDLLQCPVMLAPEKYKGSDIMTGAEVAAKYPNFSYLIDDEDAVYCDNTFYTDPRLITAPSVLTQEQPLLAQANYNFNFAANSAPEAGFGNNSAIFLNNVTLAKNNVCAIYGIRFRIGYDDENGIKRIYQTYGRIAGDNFIYNGLASMKVETETQVDQLNMDDFKEVPIASTQGINKFYGMQLIDPTRLYSGQLGKFFVNWQPFNDNVTGLELTANAVFQCTLFIVSGQASASA